jgi:hypothetical protein
VGKAGDEVKASAGAGCDRVAYKRTQSLRYDLTDPVGRLAMEEHPGVALGQHGAEF